MEQPTSDEERRKQIEIIKVMNFAEKCPKLTPKEFIMMGYEPSAVAEVFKEEAKPEEPIVNEETETPGKYSPYVINWVDDEYLCSWTRIKPFLTNRLKEGEDLFMMAHSKDEIIGKPQLVSEVKSSLPLVLKVKKIEDEKEVIRYKFIDDRYDKRYDGYEEDSIETSFYIYRVIFKDIEYMVFSGEKLEPELYTFKGMKIKMPVGTELTKTLKIRSIANIFFSKEAHSSIRLISKGELVAFTKKLGIDYGLDMDGWRDFLFTHPDDKTYLHSDMYNKIRIAQLLSGKWEGYPLHVLNMGPLAKGKTKELECLDYIFREEKGICEAGNSTPKALVPSYKEKPASPGYILNCVRIALVDELMKMVSNAMGGTRQEDLVKNALGQLNMILEHKKRLIGSGNDNSLVAKATAKCLFQSNPLQGKRFLEDHLDMVDSTTLSRMLCVVQDKTEQDFIDSNIPEVRNNSGNTKTTLYTLKKEGCICIDGVTTNIPLLIYDNCQEFNVVFDIERVRSLFKTSISLAPERMKAVWKGRGLHHTILLLDGLVKWRCLFKDYDYSFTALEQDYVELEALISNIVLSWKTDLNPPRWQESFRGASL